MGRHEWAFRGSLALSQALGMTAQAGDTPLMGPEAKNWAQLSEAGLQLMDKHPQRVSLLGKPNPLPQQLAGPATQILAKPRTIFNSGGH